MKGARGTGGGAARAPIVAMGGAILAGMTGALLKALLALVPMSLLFAWSAASWSRARTVWSVVQLAGAGCLAVVVLTHICEALRLFPAMQWGSPTSIGHYLDLSSALLGLTLLPVGYLGSRISRRRTALG